MYHGETLNSISHLAGAVMALMGLGALLAVVFYIMDKLDWFTHVGGIWYLLVLVGSSCHFTTVFSYVR